MIFFISEIMKIICIFLIFSIVADDRIVSAKLNTSSVKTRPPAKLDVKTPAKLTNGIRLGSQGMNIADITHTDSDAKRAGHAMIKSDQNRNVVKGKEGIRKNETNGENFHKTKCLGNVKLTRNLSKTSKTDIGLKHKDQSKLNRLNKRRLLFVSINNDLRSLSTMLMKLRPKYKKPGVKFLPKLRGQMFNSHFRWNLNNKLARLMLLKIGR